MGQVNLQQFFNNDEEAYGVVRAYDPNTLDPKWEYKMNDITWGGVLTTAGDVVFSGGKEGYFFALDARTGALLWKARRRWTGQRRTDELLGQRQASTSRSRRAARCSPTRCQENTMNRREGGSARSPSPASHR